VSGGSSTCALLATTAYSQLAAALCAQTGFEPAKLERREFPDGERYLRILSRCRGRDVIVLGGTISDADTLEIYDLAWGAVHEGATSLTLVIPFYGYSTRERAVAPGEIVTAKARARLLSSIPLAAMGNRVFLVDLHAHGIEHYFENDITSVHVYAKPVIKQVVKQLGGDDYVLACTDAGRAKWVESLANDLGVQAAFVYKRRLAGDRTEVAGVSAQVTGKQVVIYDDMIRTGGSLLGAAAAYRSAGAVGISAVATHGLFPGDALRRLESSGLIDRIVCTDSHPRALALRGAFLQVVSIAPVLAERLLDGAGARGGTS
jgi:ribose-phosphate pyrophosphokinase